MAGTGCSQVRLAELVAALSLGVDLGFGQPMEHVLRQCLIALRLADQAGLAGRTGPPSYYTALLVNVGCHADAHEQAKWFGDDIALNQANTVMIGSFRAMVATMRLVGSGNPPLHRFRVGLEFALTGHACWTADFPASRWPGRWLAARPFSQVREAIGAAYERWDGRGWPGALKAGRCRSQRGWRSWPSQEVAHRVSGIAGATALARRRAGKQFDPALAALVCARAEEIFGGIDAVPAWQAVIAAERPLLRGCRRPNWTGHWPPSRIWST